MVTFCRPFKAVYAHFTFKSWGGLKCRYSTTNMTSVSIVFALYIFPLPLPSTAEPFLIRSGRWFESVLTKLMALNFFSQIDYALLDGKLKEQNVDKSKILKKKTNKQKKLKKKPKKKQKSKNNKGTKGSEKGKKQRDVEKEVKHHMICFFWWRNDYDYCITKGWPRKRLRHTMNLGGVH